MAAQTAAKLRENAIVKSEQISKTALTARLRRRPNRSAATPLGTSHSRLVRWNTASARPICASVKPRAASSTTQTASVSRRQDVNEYTRTARNCFGKFIGNTLSVYVFCLTHKKQVPKNKRPHSKAAGPKKAYTFCLALLGWFNLKMGTLPALSA